MSLLPTYNWGDPELARWLDRSPSPDQTVTESVARTLAAVRSEGADAVLAHARRFDATDLQGLFVSVQELEMATCTDEQLDALGIAIARVRDFHALQLEVLTMDMEPLPRGWGWRTDATDHEDTGFEGQRVLPLRRVGVYVPGGRAAYPSSVVMNVVPAQVAGTEELVLATPARADGSVHPLVLVACRLLGVQTVLKCGGAAAVAALALGIEGLPRVDKVVGPGNAYVNEAKRQLWGVVGLDGFAGPSEVAVAVDGSADPRFAAADLLAQLEHAPDNVGMLVGSSAEAVAAVVAAAALLLKEAPRADILSESLRAHSVAVVVGSPREMAEALNLFAPEHASLLVSDPAALASELVNCGCMALGPHTSQAAGDYLSGPSHTLPTGGAARFGSPVNVLDFLKIQSVSMFTASDIKELAPTIAALARAEGFPAHAFDAEVRA